MRLALRVAILSFGEHLEGNKRPPPKGKGQKGVLQWGEVPLFFSGGGGQKANPTNAVLYLGVPLFQHMLKSAAWRTSVAPPGFPALRQMEIPLEIGGGRSWDLF